MKDTGRPKDKPLKDRQTKKAHDHYGAPMLLNGKYEINCVVLDNEQQRFLRDQAIRNHKMVFTNSPVRERFHMRLLQTFCLTLKFKSYHAKRVHLLENETGQLAFATPQFLFPILTRERPDSYGYQVIDNNYFSFLIELLRGKQFVTYGSTSAVAVKLALETMGQHVESLGKANQRELGFKFLEIQKELPTFQKIIKGDKKELQISNSMSKAYHEQVGSVFWEIMDLSSCSSSEPESVETNQSFMILKGDQEETTGCESDLGYEPQQRTIGITEFSDFEDSDFGDMEDREYKEQESCRKMVEKMRALRIQKKAAAPQEEEKKSETTSGSEQVNSVKADFGKLSKEVVPKEKKEPESLFDELRKSMFGEQNIKLNYMTHIFIENGSFVKKQFKNQYEEDGFSKIEIVQFSNEMRHLAKECQSRYRFEIKSDQQFVEMLVGNFKKMIVAREKSYEDCMANYIEYLIRGGKIDFDKFYRQQKAN